MLGVLDREYAPVVVTALSILGVNERLTLRSGVLSRSLSLGSRNAIRGETDIQLVVLGNFRGLFERRTR
jgi:hypothetical protein